MKRNLVLVLKGFIIGLGKIIPGVSGSLIAVSMGLYEKCIDCISHFFTDIKNNIIFLGSIAIGIVLAIILGSRVIFVLLKHCYVPMISLFIGLIAGSMNDRMRKTKIKTRKDLLLVSLGIILMIFIELISPNKTFRPSIEIGSFIIILLLGFLDATTMIIPGISGTAIFIMLGCYSFILELFGNVWNLFYIWYVVFFGLGLIIGIIVVSKVVDCLLKKHKQSVSIVILGFALSSICMLLKEIAMKTSKLSDIILGLVFMGSSFLIMKNKKSE